MLDSYLSCWMAICHGGCNFPCWLAAVQVGLLLFMLAGYCSCWMGTVHVGRLLDTLDVYCPCWTATWHVGWELSMLDRYLTWWMATAHIGWLWILKKTSLDTEHRRRGSIGVSVNTYSIMIWMRVKMSLFFLKSNSIIRESMNWCTS